MATTKLCLLVSCIAAIGIAAIGMASLATPSRAVDASAWHTDAHSAVRVIGGGGPSHPGASLRAGIEMKLGPGWKTYWRYPGDSGVPPRFDFSGSENVQSVRLLWPAPHSFVDETGKTIGYKDDVIFPLEIVPTEAAKPVTLRVKLDYAICEKLCLPASAEAELVLSDATSAQALASAEELVPKRSALGAGDPVAIRSVHRDPDAKPERVLVDVAAPDDAAVELFAEGPTPEWALPVPEQVGPATSGLRRFAFALDGLPPAAQPDGATLTLTLVAGDRSVEVSAPLN
jgi:DsbC/DsbD-like thiol-disulfide interchange protein